MIRLSIALSYISFISGICMEAGLGTALICAGLLGMIHIMIYMAYK